MCFLSQLFANTCKDRYFDTYKCVYLIIQGLYSGKITPFALWAPSSRAHTSLTMLKNSLSDSVHIAKWVLFRCWLDFNGLKSLVFKPQCLKTCENYTFLWPRSTATSRERVTAMIVQNLYRLIVSTSISPTPSCLYIWFGSTTEVYNTTCSW